MATTTRAAGSPAKRSLVWSHNTTYTGAAGVHSEVSRKAHALNVTNQRELNSNLSTIESLHRKELQHLRQHRKSLETSMLAYTEKMRRISTDRLQLADGSSAQNNATLERLFALSKAASSTKANTQSRVSIDSGIDFEEASSWSDVAEASYRSTTMKKSASHPVLNQRPSSFSTTDTRESSDSGQVKKDGRRRRATEQIGVTSRQRRPGVTVKPDIVELKQSLENPTTSESQTPDEKEEEEDGDRTSSAVPSDVSVAITPFPEFRLQVGDAQGETHSTPSVFDEDDDRLHGTTSRTSQASVKKSKKTKKDDYWSYRKSPRRHSTTPRSEMTVKPQKQMTKAASPVPAASRRNRGLIRGPKPPPPPKPKPFNHTFRYSEAVEGVIKSIDQSKDVDEKTFRRASKILPALDIEDLREERRRLQEEAKKVTAESQHEELVSPSVEDSGVSSEEDQVVTVARERSISAPNILEYDPDSGCGSDGEAEQGEPKSVLRKYDSGFLNISPRKTVQFCLPELTREVHIAS